MDAALILQASKRACSSLQVIQLRRQLKAQVAEVEKAIAKQLKSYPALKPYAKQPYLAYITWAALALPLVIILLPFFLFTGAASDLLGIVTHTSMYCARQGAKSFNRPHLCPLLAELG